MTCIPGAAITNIKMDGVLHEFSTIKGVKEDVMDIIQNLKGVRFKLTDSNPDKVRVKMKGKGTFTAAEIQKVSDQFEILNPDHYITDLNSSGKIDMEIRVGIGRGYVSADEN
jgi:DNA-directed RNA polymerase subunit alpha